MKDGQRNAFIDNIPLFALCLSLALNIAQYSKRVYATPAASIYNFQLPREGQVVSNLHVLALDGTAATLPLATRTIPTIVYVMSPTCRWCGANLGTVNTLPEQLGGKYRIIGLSRSSTGLGEYIAHHPYAFPVYSIDPHFPDPGITLDVTPRTLIFAPDGHFVKGWNGAYINETRGDVASYLNISLPPAT